jgi:hypothetical protein
MQHKYFFHWWKYQCNCILESCTEEPSIAPEFLGHCRNDAAIPVTLFFKTRRSQIRQVMRVGNYSYVFSSRELLLFLLVGPSSEYGTSEYSSTWILWMFCAQFLRHKKQHFFPALYFQEKLFLNLQFSLQHAVWEKMNRMDGWLPGYYNIYYKITLYKSMHTNLQYAVLSCISL